MVFWKEGRIFLAGGGKQQMEIKKALLFQKLFFVSAPNGSRESFPAGLACRKQYNAANELVRSKIMSWTLQFIFVQAGGIEGRERLKKQQRKGEMWEAETASIN